MIVLSTTWRLTPLGWSVPTHQYSYTNADRVGGEILEPLRLPRAVVVRLSCNSSCFRRRKSPFLGLCRACSDTRLLLDPDIDSGDQLYVYMRYYNDDAALWRLLPAYNTARCSFTSNCDSTTPTTPNCARISLLPFRVRNFSCNLGCCASVRLTTPATLAPYLHRCGCCSR